MSQKIFKFAKRVNELIPEVSVDAIIEVWDNIEDSDQDSETKVENPTCKHMYIKGKNANSKCKRKVKGGGEYCSKHKTRRAVP